MRKDTQAYFSTGFLASAGCSSDKDAHFFFFGSFLSLLLETLATGENNGEHCQLANQSGEVNWI